MQKLSLHQMEELEGGWWATGFACAAGVLGAAVLLTNPVTMTAGIYLASAGSGALIGACAGSLTFL